MWVVVVMMMMMTTTTTTRVRVAFVVAKWTGLLCCA
jgi:hypothetical protein